MRDPGLMGRIERAGAAVDPGLTDRDVDRLVLGAARRRRRRAVVRVGLAGTAVIAVLAVVAWTSFVRRPELASSQTVVPTSTRPGGGALRLRDGSVATPLEADSALWLVRELPGQTALVLGHGRARFDVVPAPKRVFSVQAGDVTVTVLGTKPGGGALLLSTAHLVLGGQFQIAESRNCPDAVSILHHDHGPWWLDDTPEKRPWLRF